MARFFSLLSVVLVAFASSSSAAPTAQRNRGGVITVAAGPGNNACVQTERQLNSLVQQTNRALLQAANASPNDEQLLTALGGVQDGLRECLTGISNITTALSQGVAPSAEQLDLVTTGLANAGEALGTANPENPGVVPLLQNVAVGLEQSTQAGELVLAACGGGAQATETATESVEETATATAAEGEATETAAEGEATATATESEAEATATATEGEAEATATATEGEATATATECPPVETVTVTEATATVTVTAAAEATAAKKANGRNGKNRQQQNDAEAAGAEAAGAEGAGAETAAQGQQGRNKANKQQQQQQQQADEEAGDAAPGAEDDLPTVDRRSGMMRVFRRFL